MRRTLRRGGAALPLAASLPNVFAASRAGGSPLLIAQCAPLSGPMAALVTSVIAGQRAVFDQVNAQGGIGGRPIQLAVMDDGFDPKRALGNARRAVEEEGAAALFGIVGTAQTAALLPYVEQQKVPLIGPYSGSPGLRASDNKYFFTTQASYTDELVKMVRNLVTLQSAQIALVYQDNEFGKGLLPLAQKIIAQEKGTVVADRALSNLGENAAEVASGVAKAAPKAVILIAAGPSVVRYVSANRVNVGVPVYTFSVSAGTSIVRALGEGARGLAVARVVPYPWRATTRLARDFAMAMQARKLPVDYETFVGFINARVLVECLRRAEKPLSPQSIVKSLENRGHIDLDGYAVHFGADQRHGSKYVEITVLGPQGTVLR